jgi:hypothetical protein
MALLRGGNSLKHHNNVVRNVTKSFIAIPAYGLALPFVFIAGYHQFMKYLIKFFDHTGRLLALVGIKPIKDRNF